MRRAWTAIPVFCVLFPATATAALHEEAVAYHHGATALEGWISYDTRFGGPRPGVVIYHQWKGLGPFEKRQARRLARAGYIAFCADVYGRGVRPATSAEAGTLSGKYKADRALMRARARAALERLRQEPRVDDARVAAIGYCFGGTVALELARSGAAVSGAVSIHGGLATPAPAGAQAVRAKVLVLHGAADPHVPPAEVAAFQAEMTAAGADWQMVSYGGAVHAFTDPGAGGDPSRGAAYDPRAAGRAWTAMGVFFDELFARRP